MVRGKKFLSNGHVEHAPKYPKFLVHGRWLHRTSFVIAMLRFRSDVLTKTFPKEQFDVVSRYVEQPAGPKSKFQVLGRPQVGGMGL